MNFEEMIRNIVERLGDTATSQSELKNEVLGTAALLGKSIDTMVTSNEKLKYVCSQKEMSVDTAVAGVVLDDTLKSQDELRDEMLDAGAVFDEAISAMDAVNMKLKQLGRDGTTQQSERIDRRDYITAGEFATQLEGLLQGSMEHLEERLSARMLNMLKELKSTMGPARERKLQEIREAASGGIVDLSRLFGHSAIKSNIADIGVEEKQSSGIDKSLEKLRKMRGG